MNTACRIPDPPTAFARVIRVGPLRRDARLPYWDTQVLCPYCDQKHWHLWDARHPAPRRTMAPCCGNYYAQVVPARTRVPGICDVPLRSGIRCSRRVSHYGTACHLHRRHHRHRASRCEASGAPPGTTMGHPAPDGSAGQ